MGFLVRPCLSTLLQLNYSHCTSKEKHFRTAFLLPILIVAIFAWVLTLSLSLSLYLSLSLSLSLSVSLSLSLPHTQANIHSHVPPVLPKQVFNFAPWPTSVVELPRHAHITGLRDRTIRFMRQFMRRFGRGTRCTHRSIRGLRR